ncbi:DUF1134 domain-containing protein [Fundidesulfovibrio agrisoli]|uniref:DUF1134 domain-containing protein n=1 Tax=Fundidesulfovibrio agrisoli TaxID=2922717 RepID=UPI001FADE30B|nr:DUF1134 domain-containing protein [Fundidesulfovibrio agrisoli]
MKAPATFLRVSARALGLALGLAALTPFAASALQERSITDEPTVNKSQPPALAAPSGTAKGSVAPDAPAAPAPAPAAEPAPPAKSAPKQYSPPSDQNQGSWSPGGNGAAKDGGSTGPSSTPPPPAASGGPTNGDIFSMPEAKQVQTYSKKEVDEQVMGFFEGGARGLADMTSRAFERYGQPTGFIKGNEGAGALVVGLRYGEGWLYLKNGKKAYVYWQSPSVGLDLGANASKVFCLIYNMTDPEQIYQRFPSVDGSAYVVGGFGMNYQQSGNIILAPIRFGVGLRLGANVGYMHFTKERTINPF